MRDDINIILDKNTGSYSTVLYDKNEVLSFSFGDAYRNDHSLPRVEFCTADFMINNQRFCIFGTGVFYDEMYANRDSLSQIHDILLKYIVKYFSKNTNNFQKMITDIIENSYAEGKSQGAYEIQKSLKGLLDIY